LLENLKQKPGKSDVYYLSSNRYKKKDKARTIRQLADEKY
jgi:hypothetical protein